MSLLELVINFKWSEAPLNSFNVVVASSVTYVSLVLIYSNVPLAKKLFHLENTKPLVAWHNIILCVGSLIMCVGAIYEVVKRSVQEQSMEWIVCERPDTEANGMLWFWSYLFYISKYYELLDTFLQFLSGKTPPNFFLHVYHHSLVILMSWAWINSQAAPQFCGVIMNTAVHVVMYYYFYLKSQGITPKWKNYVTTFQIIQFVLSIVVVAITIGYAIQRRANTPEYPQCKGIEIVLGSLVFNATLLNGFVGVLRNNSGSKSGTTAKKVK